MTDSEEAGHTPLDGKAGLVARLLWSVAPQAYRHRMQRRIQAAVATKRFPEAVSCLRELGVLGDVEAQYQLGQCYAEGRGVLRNLPDAMVWMRRAARQGHTGAQGFLGQICSLGSARMRHIWDPERWYRVNPNAPAPADNRSVFFPSGVAVPADEASALAWYCEASKAGHPLAQVKVARQLILGTRLEKDEARALELLRQAAGQECAEAHLELARAYRHGTLVPIDMAQAVEHYRKAAEDDEIEAIFELAYILVADTAVADHKEAALWFSRGAERGHVHCQLGLAGLYQRGDGVPQNTGMAVMWYRRAARGGHPSAQFNLGRCYEFGRGVEQDSFEAAEWYRKAALQGHTQAMFNLGSLCVRGEGMPRNADAAAAFFIQAAERGHIEARINLGILHNQGRLTETSPVEAVKWFEIARVVARPEQVSHIDRYLAGLADKLPPEELERGRALARAWLEQYPPPPQ
jgi:TPR repeat protein